jgi:hypothetical protein
MILKCLIANLARSFFLISLIISLVACGGSSSPPIVPPPSSSEFIYVSNVTSWDSHIAIFEIDTAGQLKEIAGSPLQPAGGAYGLIVDPQSRFLLVAQDPGWVPAAIDSSHALSFNTRVAIAGGWNLMDPLGRFFYTSLATSTTDFNPVHVYSVTAELSFPEVAGSPFDLGIRPVAIDPAGKFLFGFNTNEVATVQIGTTGTLTKISSVSAIDEPWDIYIHPSGGFLYVKSITDFSREDLRVYKINSAGALTAVASETNFVPEGQSFQFIAFDPSGNFVFSNRCGPPCQLDTLSIDQSAGYINPKPIFSNAHQWNTAVLNTSGARLFAVSGKPGESGCLPTGTGSAEPGVLSVFAITASGQLQPITTAQTGVCPGSVVVTQ